MCVNHATLLRMKVVSRGLAHMISRAGEELIGKMRDEIAGQSTLENFDPLVAATMMIYDNALNVAPLRIAAIDVELRGACCPICALESPHWLDEAADGAKRHARSRRRGPTHARPRSWAAPPSRSSWPRTSCCPASARCCARARSSC